MPPAFGVILHLVFSLAFLALGVVIGLAVTQKKLELRDWVEWSVRVIGTIPSTNVKLLAAIIATQQVILGTQVLLAFGIDVDEGVLGILAAAAVGVDIVALKQFGKKRETAAEHVEAQARARAAQVGTGA